MDELVSVVITTHNRVSLLKQAVESVIDQTYKKLEIIIVDDNSSDNTKDYLKSIVQKDNRIKIIYIGQNETKGGNYARNKGLKASNGTYIALLDDDDYWMHDKIEKQLKLIIDKQCGLIYCNYYTEDDNNQRKMCVADAKYKGDVEQLCFTKIFCTTSMMLIKRDILFDVGLFDENLKFWQEYDILIRISGVTSVDYVDEPLMVLRVLNNDKNRLTNKYEGWQIAVDYIEDKYRDRIEKLPSDLKIEHELMVLREKAIRCDKAELKLETKKTLKEIWKITKQPKHFIKYIFNYPYFR